MLTKHTKILPTATHLLHRLFVSSSHRNPFLYNHPYNHYANTNTRAWVLIPVAVLISLGAVAACLHTSRRRRRAAQLRHESSLNNRRLTPSSPHLGPRARRRGDNRNEDLEAAAYANSTAASRWWSLPPSQTRPQPEEGLNELGEAPPPYEKAENLPKPKRNPNDANGGDGGGDDDGSGEMEMQELPHENEIAELDAGESSTARAVALNRERDSTIPKEMDASHGRVIIGEDDSDSDFDGGDVVEYRQAYAVTITSGTASRTESPASWTRGDDSSPNGRLSTRRRRGGSVDSDGGSSVRGVSVPPGFKHDGDEDDHVHDVEHTDVREPPRAVLPGEEERGRKGL